MVACAVGRCRRMSGSCRCRCRCSLRLGWAGIRRTARCQRQWPRWGHLLCLAAGRGNTLLRAALCRARRSPSYRCRRVCRVGGRLLAARRGSLRSRRRLLCGECPQVGGGGNKAERQELRAGSQGVRKIWVGTCPVDCTGFETSCTLPRFGRGRLGPCGFLGWTAVPSSPASAWSR